MFQLFSQNTKDRHKKLIQRNRVVVTNSDFLIPISLQPNVVDLKYFNLNIISKV